MKKIFKDYLILSAFISNILFALSYPSIQIFLMRGINERFISLNQIMTSIGGLVIPMIWNKGVSKLFKKYHIFLFIETSLFISIISLLILDIIDARMYYLLETLIYGLFTTIINCGMNRILSRRYDSVEREKYDNNITAVSSTSALIGYGFSFVFVINHVVAFILFGLGIIVSNIIYYKAYIDVETNEEEIENYSVKID